VSAIVTEPQQHPRGILERFLDRDERQHRLTAIDDAVIVREREIVHRADDDLPVLDHRPVLGRMHAEDRRLRRVDDRCRQHRAEHAAVGDRERAAGELLDRELAVLRALAEVGDLLLDLGERRLVGVAQDRHDEPPRAADRDADVVVAVVDDVVAVDRRVDQRELAQRVHGGLDEEAHEAELDAELLLEALLVAAAQLDHRLHVDFVERRQDGRRRLRLHPPLGDARAQPRHRHALLGARALDRGCRGVRRARGRRRRCRRRLHRSRLDRGQDVSLGDATAAAGSAHAGGCDILLGHQLARRGQCGGARAAGRRRCLRRTCGGL
jgi:hypothetical protein